MATNTGGLVDPKFQGALGSEEIKSNLQNEIQRQEKYLGSYANRRTQGAAWLSPYGNLAQSLALRDENNRNAYSDLFNMRQQLAQANLMDQRRGQVSNLFQGFDADTGASLSALYQQNPEEALKKAAEIRAENSKLPDKVKQLTAAGYKPGDAEFTAGILGDQDLGNYTKKQLVTHSLDLDKKAVEFGNQVDLETLKSGQRLAVDKDLKKFEYDLKEGSGNALQTSRLESFAKDVTTDADAALKAGKAQDTILSILLQHPEYDFGVGTEFSTKVKSALPIKSQETIDKQAIISSIDEATLKVAKALGANPSNRDVDVIKSAFGGTDSDRQVMLMKTAGSKAMGLVAREMEQKLTEAGNNKAAQLAVQKYYRENADTLYDEKLKGVLAPFGKEGQTLYQNVTVARQKFGETGESKSAAPAGQLAPGTIQNGWKFKGGNPGDKSNWEKA